MKRSQSLPKLFIKALPAVMLLASCLPFISTAQQKINPATPSIQLPKIVAVPKDSVLSITNLVSGKDSVKINEVIAIQLRSSQSIKKYNTLYLNGMKVEGLAPLDHNEFDKIVYFKLNRDVQDLAEKFLASKPVNKVVLPVSFSISNQRTILTGANLMQLEVKQNISEWGIWIMAAMLFFLVILALRHNILKDDNNVYYSLGRTQLLYWTVIIAMAYIYLCYVNGTLPDIPPSVLIILGISAATTAATKVIENDKNKDFVPIDPHAKSQGLFIDILSDAHSINIQRFQNVVFNLLFGIVLIEKTLSTNVIPEFDNNVLLLLGISAGTYAGLKSTETNNKPIPVADPTSLNPPQPPVPVTPQPASNPPT